MDERKQHHVRTIRKTNKETGEVLCFCRDINGTLQGPYNPNSEFCYYHPPAEIYKDVPEFLNMKKQHPFIQSYKYIDFYSDRMSAWHNYEAIKKAKEVAELKYNDYCWASDTIESLEKYISLLHKSNYKIIGIQEEINASNGYPYWYIIAVETHCNIVTKAQKHKGILWRDLINRIAGIIVNEVAVNRDFFIS